MPHVLLVMNLYPLLKTFLPKYASVVLYAWLSSGCVLYCVYCCVLVLSGREEWLANYHDINQTNQTNMLNIEHKTLL